MLAQGIGALRKNRAEAGASPTGAGAQGSDPPPTHTLQIRGGTTPRNEEISVPIFFLETYKIFASSK